MTRSVYYTLLESYTEETNKHTDKHIDIATYRLHRPSGRFSENMIMVMTKLTMIKTAMIPLMMLLRILQVALKEGRRVRGNPPEVMKWDTTKVKHETTISFT